MVLRPLGSHLQALLESECLKSCQNGATVHQQLINVVYGVLLGVFIFSLAISPKQWLSPTYTR